MEILQARADLETSRTLGSLALPLPTLFIFLYSLRMSVVLWKPGFAPSTIYTADNLGSPQVEPTSKPWLGLTWAKPGLGRFTLVNLGRVWAEPGLKLGRTRVSLCSVNWLQIKVRQCIFLTPVPSSVERWKRISSNT